MGEEFLKFKRKHLIDVIVRSVLSGVSVALLVIATLLIVIRNSTLELDIVYVALIGILSGLLLGTGTYFIFHLSERCLAKQIDKSLGLNEKVQTMYAFRNESGGVKELQREDARKILEEAPVKMSSLYKLWAAFLAVMLVSLAYFIVALVLWLQPSDIVEEPGDDLPPPVVTPPEDEEFNPTDHHRRELEELIKYVSESKLEDGAKQAVITELTLLLTRLDTFGTEKAMKEYVVGVIKNVRGIVNTVNATFALNLAVGKTVNDNMKKLNSAIYSLNMNAVTSELNQLYDRLVESYTSFKDGGGTNQIELLAGEFKSVLEKITLAKDNTLYVLLSGVSDALTDIAEHSYSLANVKRKLDSALKSTFLDGLKKLLPFEKNNEEVKVYVVDELERIFGITEEDFEDKRGEAQMPEKEETDRRPELGDDGGYGGGNTIFGSNDIVIDPEAEPGGNIDSINVQYGEIIGRYNAKITEMLQNGEISEELAEILRRYYELLLTPKEN